MEEERISLAALCQKEVQSMNALLARASGFAREMQRHKCHVKCKISLMENRNNACAS